MTYIVIPYKLVKLFSVSFITIVNVKMILIYFYACIILVKGVLLFSILFILQKRYPYFNYIFIMIVLKHLIIITLETAKRKYTTFMGNIPL